MLLYAGTAKNGILTFYHLESKQIRSLHYCGSDPRGSILAGIILPGQQVFANCMRVQTANIPVDDLDVLVLNDLRAGKRFGLTFMAQVLSCASPRRVSSTSSGVQVFYTIREIDLCLRTGGLIRRVRLTIWGPFLTEFEPVIGEICLVVNAHSEVYKETINLGVGDAGFIQYDLKTSQAADLKDWLMSETETTFDLVLPPGVELYQE